VTTGDVDGDGLTDLVVASAGTATLAVFLQRAGGAFGPGPDHVVGGGSLVDPRRVIAIDVNGDGACDLVCADGVGNLVHVFAGDGAGSPAAAPTWSLGSPATTPDATCVAVYDLDADGDLDLVVGHAGNDRQSVFLASGPGALPGLPSLTLGGPATTADPRAVAIADIDLDGLPDIVSANQGSNTVTVFLGTGGTWGPAPDITITHASLQAPLSLALADVDDDGDLDVVVASAATATLSICEQVALGSFAAAPRPIGGGALVSPELVWSADVDGDGDPDLLALDAVAEQVILYFNSH
jgi:hypothetical protein